MAFECKDFEINLFFLQNTSVGDICSVPSLANKIVCPADKSVSEDKSMTQTHKDSKIKAIT